MQHPAERSEKKGFLSDLFSRPESLPLLLFILFFAILYGAGPDLRSAKFIFDPPWLLIVLNTLFVMGLCLLIAGLCFRSFLRGGFLNVLLLGCGVLAFGLTSFAAGWLIRPPHGLNEALTIRNIGVLCAAAFFFLSSLFTAFGLSMEIEHRRGLAAVMAFSGVFTMGALLTAATLLHFIPPFFIAGEGPTIIRQVALAVSVTLFTLSAILMMMVYSERKTVFLLYSINALLLFGAGIVGVSLGVPGSPLSWLGRAAQYMGNVYLVVASMQALAEARRRGTSVEKALAGFFRKSERHYKALVEMAADAIVSIDREGKILLMNPVAEETFGYGRDEAAGLSLAELIVPEQSREFFHACMYGEPCRNMGMDLKRKDGSIFPAELSFSPEMKSEGGSERTIIIRDVTERRLAEEAIQSAALFPIQNPEPILRIHRDGTLLFSNPAAEPVLKEWRAASKTGFPAQVRQAVEAALNEGIARDIEVQIDGRDFSFVVTPIVKNHYANLYGRDVTESKRAEEALRKSEARLRLAHDAGKAGTWEWDLRTHENIWSEELWKLYGLDPHGSEPAYETWRQTIHPDDRAKAEQIVQDAATHGAELNAEWRVRDRDGSIRWLMSRGQPQVDVEGRPMRYIGIVVDITARKRTEEALRGSEARYRSYIEVTGQMGWTTNADGEIVEDIPGWRAYTGQTFDEMRGWGWSKALHPDDVEITLAVWRKAVEDKQGYETEYRLRRHDGVYRHFLARGVPILNDDGNLREWVGTCIDITERNQAEAALRQNEARFRQLADSMPQLVWTAEPDGRVDYYNGRLSSFTTRGPWRPAVYAEDRPRTAEAWKSAVRTGSPYEIEHRMQLADGRFRWFLTRAVPVPDETGQVVKWYGTSTDVHDRKQAEEEREFARIEAINENNRLEALIKTLPVGVAMVDTEGGNIRSNRMYDQLWGGPRPEARSVNDYDKYKAWWLDSGLAVQPDEWASARAVQKGETVTGQLLQIERFDGKGAFVTNSAAPIYDFDGRITGSAVAILDITERIEAEQALQKAKEELEDKVKERTAELILTLENLEKSRNDLRKLASELVLAEERERKKISVILHDEVAQTLAAARMRIDLLRRMPGDDDSRRVLDEAQQLLVQAIRETRALMTDISNPVLYDMGLQVAVQSLTEEVKARNGISFSSSFSGHLKTLEKDVEVMLFQLVKELVQNIVKHSGARKASILIVEEKDVVRVVVADDGQGFDAGNVGAVGLDGGFGLFSIRERVKSYHGKITIESEPGKGAEVTVMLPKKAAGGAASRKTGKRK